MQWELHPGCPIPVRIAVRWRAGSCETGSPATPSNTWTAATPRIRAGPKEPALKTPFPLLAIVGALFALPDSARAFPLPTPQDTPYAGAIRLEVDATDLDHKVLRVAK